MKMFKRQGWHYLFLGLLLAGVFVVINDNMLAGQYLGISTSGWLILAIATPIAHQIYVWFVWRTELYYSLISRWFGKNGFTYYAIGFTILFALRLVFIIPLAISNQNSFSLNKTLSIIIAIALLLPALYLFYSVRKYFGFKRAYGIDHFDASYRNMPFVRQGIFRFTGNAMYTFGFFILWVPGFLFLSQAALLAALFNHIYIWVHYYCTELPDIHYIYDPEQNIEDTPSGAKTS